MDRIAMPPGVITALTCTSCNGAGGSTETTTTGGKTLSTWRNCTSCDGRGSR